MSEFFSMGGYGGYVWSAMAVAFVLMLLETISLLVQRRSIIRDIKRVKRLEQRRQNDQAGR